MSAKQKEPEIRVDRERQALIALLEGMLPTPNLEAVGYIADDIDNIVCGFLSDSLSRNADILFDCTRRTHSNTTYLEFDGGLICQLMYSLVDVNKPRHITFMCLPQVTAHTLSPYQTIEVDEVAGVSSVGFTVPGFIKVDEWFLAELVRTCFSVSYRWLREGLRASVKLAIRGTEKSLYDFVRLAVSDDRILEGLLFAAVADGEDGKRWDFVVLDEMAVEACVKLASGRGFGARDRNAMSVATQMVTDLVAYDDSIIGIAAEKKEAMELDLKSDDAYRDNPSLKIALRTVWGDSVTCYPIVTEGDILLVAFYPRKYATSLTELFDREKTRLQALASQNSDAVMQNLSKMQRIAARAAEVQRSLLANPGDVGAFTGGLIAGFFKGVSGP